MASFHVSVILACGKENFHQGVQLSFVEGSHFVVDVAFVGRYCHGRKPGVEFRIALGQIEVYAGDTFQGLDDVVIVCDGGVKLGPETFQIRCEYGIQKATLVSEVMVQRGLANACGVCHFLHAGSVVAFAAEEDQGLLQ